MSEPSATTWMERLEAGEVSSRELVELSLARIEESQPRLNAFRVVCAEAALEEADHADARLGRDDGASTPPLLGGPCSSG